MTSPSVPLSALTPDPEKLAYARRVIVGHGPVTGIGRLGNEVLALGALLNARVVERNAGLVADTIRQIAAIAAAVAEHDDQPAQGES